jgi:hypothetical protein
MAGRSFVKSQTSTPTVTVRIFPHRIANLVQRSLDTVNGILKAS